MLHETPDLLDKLTRLESEPCPATPILFVKIKLLWQCNLACTFCELPAPLPPMSKAQVMEILRNLRQRGLQKVHYSGGEVFLHPEIFEILAESCQAGLQVNLTSNGTLLDRQKIKHLAKMKVHSITISLDAADPKVHDSLRGKPGAFRAAVKTLRLLAQNPKKRPIVRVNTVVTQQNMDQLDRLHELLSTINPQIAWKLIPVDSLDCAMRLNEAMVQTLSEQAARWDLVEERPFGAYQVRGKRLAKDLRTLARGKHGKRYYDDHRCYMPWLSLFIAPDGFVYACCMMRGHATAFGNIYHNTLDEILQGPIYREFRMNMALQPAMEVCRYCDDFIRENALIEEATGIDI